MPPDDLGGHFPFLGAPDEACETARHAAANAASRGATPSEVVVAIRTAPWTAAERGRLECRLTLPYGREWNGRQYATKTVRPVFVDEPEEVVVVTVYAYYR